MAQNGDGLDEADQKLVEQIKAGGTTGRNIVFGVAQKNIRQGRTKEALQWLRQAFKALPEEDQRNLQGRPRRISADRSAAAPIRVGAILDAGSEVSGLNPTCHGCQLPSDTWKVHACMGPKPRR